MKSVLSEKQTNKQKTKTGRTVQKVPQKVVGGTILLSPESTLSVVPEYLCGRNTERFCESLLLENSVPLADGHTVSCTPTSRNSHYYHFKVKKPIRYRGIGT